MLIHVINGTWACLRHRETGEEPLEEAALVQGRQSPAKLTLGCTGGPNVQDVLSSHGSQQQQSHLQHQQVRLETLCLIAG